MDAGTFVNMEFHPGVGRPVDGERRTGLRPSTTHQKGQQKGRQESKHGIEVAVSEGARYRVQTESAQGRTWAGNAPLFDVRLMNTPTSVYAEMTPNPRS